MTGSGFRIGLAALTLLVLVVGVLAFAVAASGVVPVSASAGHFPPVRWFLKFAKVRSVSTWTLLAGAPPLDDPGLVVRGAGHFETTCRACHGAPGFPPAPVSREMTPVPPALDERIPDWDDDELFYIVMHGIKMTGMPAWPARDREDEVWAVVAFLRTLPDLDGETYRGLALGGLPDPVGTGAGIDPRVPEAVRVSCARCHGVDGRGRGVGAYPRLDGQTAAYLEATLSAYASGERHSGIMEPVAAELSPAAIRRVARHYARRSGSDAASGGPVGAPDSVPVPEAGEGASPLPRPERSSGGGDPDRGERLARFGDPARKVPACVACHGPGDGPRNPRFPRIAGQDPGYLAQQLRLFRDEVRGGTAYAPIMREVASSLSGRDIADLAAWYGSLTWGDDTDAAPR